MILVRAVSIHGNYLNHHQGDLLAENDPRRVEGERRVKDVVDQWLQDVCPGAHLQLEEVTAADAIIAGFTFDRPGDVESNRYRADQRRVRPFVHSGRS